MPIRPFATLLASGRDRISQLFGDHSARAGRDIAEVQSEVYGAAGVSFAYVMLSVCSCGIAVFGLLQSSAAVVIGAMLISPLMGPIIGMGVALAELQPRRFLRASASLAAGAALSVLVAALIVWLSPLKEVTPEILARTRPNLLDLVIALLSGVVGAYVTLTRRGGVIAGVAIATALMPPLAVTGYGLATRSGTIAGGSFLLFLTNVVAILGAVLAVARSFGFKRPQRAGARWEEIVLALALVALATPLGFSLRDIVTEAKQNDAARRAITHAFASASPDISNLSVATEHHRLSSVRAVVVTRHFVAGAPQAVKAALGGSADVEIEQILAVTRAHAEPTESGGALANRALADRSGGEAAGPVASDPKGRLTALLGQIATLNVVVSDHQALEAIVTLKRPAALDDYRSLEAAAQSFFPDLSVRLVPPMVDLDPIRFDAGESRLSPASATQLSVAAWALKRWRTPGVVVTGSASPSPHGPTAADRKLALARAQAVADRLQMLGIATADTRERVDPIARARKASMWSAEIQRSSPSSAEGRSQRRLGGVRK